MSLLECARKRLQAVLDEIARVAETEFPYKGSEHALKKLENLYRSRLSILNQLNDQSNTAILKQACSLALGDLFHYLPMLGFIVRSTNVRNAFEVFRPVLRLARDVLEPQVPKQQQQTQLVLSSEWDYSPFIYRDIPGLPGFVLIGLPSPESSNPLLVPLAGHELGHSVWVMNGRAILNAVRPVVRRRVVEVIRSRWAEYQTLFPGVVITQAQLGTNLAAVESWERAVAWAVNQAEETFCDFVGLRLFGVSYLEAFAYLLAPVIPGERSLVYPSTLARVSNLVSAARSFGANVPTDFVDRFDDDDPPTLTAEDDFRLSVADQALGLMIPDLINLAEQVVVNSGLPAVSQVEEDRIYARYRLVVPAEGCLSLADILNAAWRAYGDTTLWQDNPQIAKKKDEALKELVLKNIELFEIEQILGPKP